MRDYRGLIVWQRAHSLALTTRKLSQRFGRSEYSALRSQIVRAAESIPANIAEGCFAASQRDFARFLDISVKSSGELEYHLHLAHDYGVLAKREWVELTAEVIDVRRMLVGLRRRVLASATEQSPAARR